MPGSGRGTWKIRWAASAPRRSGTSTASTPPGKPRRWAAPSTASRTPTPTSFIGSSHLISLSPQGRGQGEGWWSRARKALPLSRQHHSRPRQVRGGHQQHHLRLVADAEGVHGLGELALEHHADALALEEAADDEGLRLIAAAPRFHERPRGQARRGRTAGGRSAPGGGAGREADDLGAARGHVGHASTSGGRLDRSPAKHASAATPASAMAVAIGRAVPSKKWPTAML